MSDCKIIASNEFFGINDFTKEQQIQDGLLCPDIEPYQRILSLAFRCVLPASTVQQSNYTFTAHLSSFDSHKESFITHLTTMFVTSASEPIHILQIGAFEGVVSTWLAETLLVNEDVYHCCQYCYL